MLFSSWLRNWKCSLERRSALGQIRRRKPSVRRVALRPRLEVLEDRTVLTAPYNPVTAGLISSYSFDSAIVDDVGLNNPSAVSGASLVGSKTGNGLTLAPGGYVDIADNGTLDNQTFSVAAWVRPLGPDTNNGSFGGAILVKNVSDTTSSFQLGWNASTGHFNLFCDSTLVSSKDAFAPGPYYHVAATYDGTTLSLYVNGVLEGQQTGIGSIIYDTTDPWTIGSNGPAFRPGLSTTFNGVIDDVDFYNRALSATEIQSIVAAAPANAPPNANAGGPYVIAAGSGVTLNASASSDPDNDPLTYSWTINGQADTASGVQPTLSWAALQALGISAGQSYQVSVTVNDGQGHAVTSPNAVLWVASQLPSLPVTAGLVSSYSFDSGVVDEVGLNNPSAVSGASLVPSKVGNGLSLAPGGYVDIADNGTLDNQQFTITAWVRPEGPDSTGDTAGGIIVDKAFYDNGLSAGVNWSALTDRFYFFFGSAYIASQDTFAAGPFYHVAATYDGNTYKLYINGNLEAQYQWAHSTLYNPAMPWNIGGGSTFYPEYARTFNGIIDEVNIYDRPLSSTEIGALVAAAPANAPPNANAGGPYVIAAGNGVTLNASASSDPDNDPLTYSWTINGHAGAAAGVQPTLSWTALQALGVSAGQSYQVSVTVDDGQGHTVTSPNAVLWVASQLPLLAVTSGLVSSYSFDSGVVDDVGLNNPSAVSGATLVPGKFGNGLSLAPGGYVDIADNGTLDNQTFTVSAWVEPGDNFANSQGGAIIDKQLTDASESVGLYYFSTTHQFYFYFNGPNSPIVSSDTFAPDSFYHVAVSYDGSTYRLYVNGVLEGQSAVTQSIIYDPTVPWTIGTTDPGSRNAGYPWTWNGVIDEVNFYDRALSAPEMEALASGQPDTLTVTSTADTTSSTTPGLTLREAIQLVNSGAFGGKATINFDLPTGSVITLNGTALPTINPFVDLTITGLGASKLAISGDHQSRVFTIDAGAKVDLTGLTIEDGNSSSYGGGIYNSGTLTVSNSTLADNSAQLGGGIQNVGTLTVSNSTLTGNSASLYGGAIRNDLGRVTVGNSTFTGNSGGSGGGGIISNATLTVSDSTFVSNSAYDGGGIYCGGNVTVTNSTFVGNSATYGGGINSNATLEVTNSTLAGNSATYGGGISNELGLTATLNNTIVADSTSGGDLYLDSGNGSVFSGSYDVIGDGSDLSDFGPHSTSGNPLLAPLGNYGGPTETMALLPGSPAIDAGSVALAVDANGKPLTTDQRGVGFPRVINGTVDIGAVESNGATLESLLQQVLSPSYPITVQANTDTDVINIISAVNHLPSYSTPVTVTINLAGVTFSDIMANLPNGVTLVLNGQGGTTIVGHSPALTVSSGSVVVDNVTLTTSTNAPTVLVEGGSLTLSGDTLSSSTSYSQAALAVTGGSLALGSTNTINVNGAGQFLQADSFSGITEQGDNLEHNGSLIAHLLSLTSVSSSASTSVYGRSIALTSTVSTVNGGTPTGSVDFYDVTTNQDLGSATVVAANGSYQAVLTTSALSAGTHNIIATYSGDGTYGFSSGSLNQVVNRATPTLTVSDAGGTYNQSPFAAIATVTGVNGIAGSGLEGVTPTLTYYSGSTASGTPLSGAPFLPGTYTVVASFAGSADYTAASATTTFTISTPTTSITGPTIGVPGQPLTDAFAVNGPTQGIVFNINYGDGTSLTTGAGGPSIKLDHLYTATGSFTIQVTATDKYGVTSQLATLPVTIGTVEMENDPSGGTALAVGGNAAGGDAILVSATDSTGRTVDVTISTAVYGASGVTINTTDYGTFTPTGHILVYGQGGKDIITLLPYVVNHNTYYYIEVPAFLYGEGSGGDVISAVGSAANNVLTGHGNYEVLTGGHGRDLLIAGTGSATLIAGAQDDILIGGWTNYDIFTPGITGLTYDQKLADLDAIMAEWGSVDSYATRLSVLATYLNTSTVHDNYVTGQPVADLLVGNAYALDWFFAGVDDYVKGTNNNDVITPIS